MSNAHAPAAAAIEDRLLAFVRDELLPPDAAIDRDTSLLSGEVLDSMSVLRLVAFAGDAFGISIRPADFVIEHFRTIGALAAYVQSRMAAQTAPDPLP